MGNACCQDVQHNTTLMMSEMPKKQEYQTTKWPEEDTFIRNYLDSYATKFKEVIPMKHKQKQVYYAGDWNQTVPQGEGIIYIPETLVYQGNFAEGKPEGKGMVSFIKLNCSYDGQVSKGQANGYGRFVHDQDKYQFNGRWEYSKPKAGNLTFSGNKTNIEFLDFEKNSAKIQYDDDKIYHGQLDPKTFLPNGIGECDFPDGSTYNGQFLDGRMHGKGIFKWPSRPGKQPEIYDGQYQYGLKSGNGKFTFGSGNIYEGQWKQGRRHGKGIMVDKNGVQIQNGYWNQGKYSGQSWLQNEASRISNNSPIKEVKGSAVKQRNQEREMYGYDNRDSNSKNQKVQYNQRSNIEAEQKHYYTGSNIQK